MIQTSRNADEQEVFKRFLQSQPGLIRDGWRYDGAHREQPDFVHPEERIGVELAEWLDRKQTRKARERERFEKEINQSAELRGLTPFVKSLKACAEARYTVCLGLRKLPSRNEKTPVIGELLDYLPTVRRPGSDRECKSGVVLGSADLPKDLARYFSRVRIFEARSRASLGILIPPPGGAADPSAVKALLAIMKDKTVKKSGLYCTAKCKKNLQELWLLLHYGRGLRWNTPYPTRSEPVIVKRAREFINQTGPGPFDRVFLLFDMTPSFGCIQLF